MKICQWCSSDFSPNVSYQIYCSSECRELATRQKVNNRYQLKKRKKLSEKQRKCVNDCGTILSMYNSDGVCYACSVNSKKVDRALKELRGIVDYEKFE